MTEYALWDWRLSKQAPAAKSQTARGAEPHWTFLRFVEMPAMIEMAAILNSVLYRAAIKVLKEMKWMVAHSDQDVRGILTVLRESDGVYYLSLAYQELRVVLAAPVSQPSRIQSQDSDPHAVNCQSSHVGQAIIRWRATLF